MLIWCYNALMQLLIVAVSIRMKGQNGGQMIGTKANHSEAERRFLADVPATWSWRRDRGIITVVTWSDGQMVVVFGAQLLEFGHQVLSVLPGTDLPSEERGREPIDYVGDTFLLSLE